MASAGFLSRPLSWEVLASHLCNGSIPGRFIKRIIIVVVVVVVAVVVIIVVVIIIIIIYFLKVIIIIKTF